MSIIGPGSFEKPNEAIHTLGNTEDRPHAPDDDPVVENKSQEEVEERLDLFDNESHKNSNVKRLVESTKKALIVFLIFGGLIVFPINVMAKSAVVVDLRMSIILLHLDFHNN